MASSRCQIMFKAQPRLLEMHADACPFRPAAFSPPAQPQAGPLDAIRIPDRRLEPSFRRLAGRVQPRLCPPRQFDPRPGPLMQQCQQSLGRPLQAAPAQRRQTPAPLPPDPASAVPPASRRPARPLPAAGRYRMRSSAPTPAALPIAPPSSPPRATRCTSICASARRPWYPPRSRRHPRRRAVIAIARIMDAERARIIGLAQPRMQDQIIGQIPAHMILAPSGPAAPNASPPPWSG